MKCSAASVVAASGWVVFATFLLPVRGLAGDLPGQGTFGPTAQSIAYFYGANASDGSPPNRELAEAAHSRNSVEAQAAVSPQERAVRERVTKGCRWGSAKDCGRSVQHVHDFLRDRRGRSLGTASPAPRGPVVVDAHGSLSDRGTLFRVANLPAGSSGGIPALSVVSESGSSAALSSAGSTQSPPIIGLETLNAVSVAATTSTYPSSKAGRKVAAGADQLDARESPAPSPYTMLLIGMTLALFIVIRRMGHV